jgi:hypothetical protein
MLAMLHADMHAVQELLPCWQQRHWFRVSELQLFVYPTVGGNGKGPNSAKFNAVLFLLVTRYQFLPNWVAFTFLQFSILKDKKKEISYIYYYIASNSIVHRLS